MVVLPNTPASQAGRRAQAWRQGFAQRQAALATAGPPITLSAGVAEFPTHGATAEVVIHAADRALYAAKDAGRDRVVVYKAN